MAIKAEFKNNTVTEPNTSATTREAHHVEAEESNRRKELHFKATHALLICFLLWILYVRSST